MSATSWIIHLVGFPAVGKRTVAVELVKASEEAPGDRFVLIDNHLSSNPILAVLDGQGSGTVGDEVWDLVDQVRDVVDHAILELAPAERSFVFTNSPMAGDASGIRAVARVQRLAEARNSTYVPVVVSCDRDELLRRVPAADRRHHGKWTVAAEVANHLDHHQVLRPDSPHLLDLDTSATPAARSAQVILDHLAAVDRAS
ncbi:MAG: hypothetical protein JST91_05670 [Actinobacteria bacterium]|nr:hypothetical protein [Actinomycetota bacterium]